MIKLYLNDKKFIFLKLFNMFLPKDRNTIYTNFVFSIRSGDTITNYKAYRKKTKKKIILLHNLKFF